MIAARWALPFVLVAAAAAGPGPAPSPRTFSTLITTPLALGGLAITSDRPASLYAVGRESPDNQACPIYSIPLLNSSLKVVGTVPSAGRYEPCLPSGLAFGPDHVLYVALDDGHVFRVTPEARIPAPRAVLFASGVPGSKALAIDWKGNVWTGDGTTGLGRVWRIAPDGVVTLAFRIPPMASTVSLTPGEPLQIGRVVRALPGPARQSQIVASGLQFDPQHNLYIADTTRGAIWQVPFTPDARPMVHAGCDPMFPPGTLCLDHVWVQHPFLEGAAGLALDESGNVWVDVSERNAVVFVEHGTLHVTEVFRNPVDPATHLRNAGPLEAPTTPVLVGQRFCTASSGHSIRDNWPGTAGELGKPTQPKGKISCLDQPVTTPGLALPIR
jgi:sugar lactone lactonase YvrE